MIVYYKLQIFTLVTSDDTIRRALKGEWDEIRSFFVSPLI